MRSRTLREGSVGLLIIFSVLLFGGVALWLKGIKFGEQGYQIVADFPDVNGIQVGDPVRYRGLRVGQVTGIQPSTNGVDVAMEISSSQLLIPRRARVQASSSGLIGETFVDIIPEAELSSAVADMNPVGKNCDSNQVLCQNTRLVGEKGITLDDLLPLTYRFSKTYSDPQFVSKLEDTFINASAAATEVAALSRNVSSLVNNVERELANISTVTKTVTDVANNTSTELVATAEKYQTTAEELNKLTKSVNQLVDQNKSNLVATLNSISTTSDRLQGLVVKLDKTVDSADTEKLVTDLETLTANAAQASENFKEITNSLNNPNSAVSLQQTLDSARVTFANTQKITSDLEAITGDPIFLENVKNLVNGLSNLVSQTDRLEQQIYTRKTIEPLQQALSSSNISFSQLELPANSLEIASKKQKLTNIFPTQNSY
jgi:phospholipid/cholesterol/gamma-HCH transport system substrate-binding protein